jgi:hypothetical protein
MMATGNNEFTVTVTKEATVTGKKK